MNDKREFHTLDGLRGVAALVVVILHAQTYDFVSFGPQSGALAVDLFFCLSGFVLEHVYGPRFRNGLTARAFMTARLIRLYPLYGLGAAVAVCTGAATLLLGEGALNGPQYVAAAVAALLMLPSPTWQAVQLSFVFNSPGWSLFFEMVVNLVFVLTWRWLSRPVLLAIVAACCAALLVMAGVHRIDEQGVNWSTFAGGFPRVGLSFFAGVLVRRFYAGAHRPGWFGWLLPLAIVPIAFASPPADLVRVYELACVLVAFPALIALGAVFEPTGKGVAIFRKLGAMSYPLYTLHYPALQLTARVRNMLHLDGTVFEMVLLAFTATVTLVVCWFIVELYDEPARAFLTAKFRARRALA